ncbi:XdhC family protein (plasmid) [Halorussus vallis]|nr:XdhC family protein [Halorussus vallis]USZ78235.1 XdhC family protein [Halorussus vallis]
MDAAESPWSATSTDIHRTIRRYREDDIDAALATVVDVEGSGYRRPGAKMVVESGGDSRGAVTAGCLEGPLIEVAKSVIESGAPSTTTYDLTDDEGAWGLGLGCNGVIDVLVEPVDASIDPALDELAAKRSATVLTAVTSTDPNVEVGDRCVVTESGRVHEGRPSLPAGVVRQSLGRSDGEAESRQSGYASVETDEGTVRVFVDGVEPTPDLLLFGGQEDINPVASLARRAGFRVRVATARGGHADADRFPAADEVTVVRPADLRDLVDAPAHTYAVLMSHNLLDDSLALDSLLDAGVPYVGLMGPRKRFREVRKRLRADGRELDEAALDRIATPVGLDIGGDEPIAVGFSIVSELIAVRNGRDGGRLANRAGPIHERTDAFD